MPLNTVILHIRLYSNTHKSHHCIYSNKIILKLFSYLSLKFNILKSYQILPKFTESYTIYKFMSHKIGLKLKLSLVAMQDHFCDCRKLDKNDVKNNYAHVILMHT